MQIVDEVVEEYADTKQRLERELALSPGRTVQMLFRLGHAEATPHTPRRDVHALLRAGRAG